jgi:membrane fusion protein, multidrug efflux system
MNDAVSTAPEDTGEPGSGSVLAKSRRKPLLIGLAVVVAVIAALFLLYEVLFAGRSVSTDNAYVAGETAQVTPLTAGKVAAVLVNDTDTVKQGQVLIRLDDADQKIAYAQAMAGFEYAQRRYRQSLAQNSALSASASASGAAIPEAEARLASAQADLEKARTDYERRAKIADSGAVSGEELTSARAALTAARAAVREESAALARARADAISARENAAASRSLTAGTTIEDAPEIQAARSRLMQAKLDLDRTVIRAPIDGVIAQRSIQVGQRLETGHTAMEIVPVGRLYVDANFKETQLGKVRAGQPATLTSDFYGGDVVYHGRVVGFSGGTGSAFSLIPAQNATGNWIKVVQRLPVRIELDPEELRAHPLRIGLSMEAEIDLTGGD